MIQYLEISPEEILSICTSVLSEKQHDLAFRGKAQGLIAQGETWIDKKSSLYLEVPRHLTTTCSNAIQCIADGPAIDFVMYCNQIKFGDLFVLNTYKGKLCIKLMIAFTREID